MTDLRVHVDGRELASTWTDENPQTQDALAAALPLEGRATRWGDEYYFRTDVEAPPENTQTDVPVGAVAYWPQGQALCLFWGPTPASIGEEPRAAAPVNVVARVEDVEPLAGVEGGVTMRVDQRK